jgi:hypothetical protein
MYVCGSNIGGKYLGNILPESNAAPALLAHQKELERSRAADALKKGLGKRPEKEDLVERNILPESNAAPALLAHQKELEKHMRKDSLDRQLHKRPKPEDLIEKGILNRKFLFVLIAGLVETLLMRLQKMKIQQSEQEVKECRVVEFDI